MKISPETEELLDKTTSYSGKLILNRYDASILIEASFFSGREKLFRDAVFTAKYITGLKKILSDNVVNKDQYMEKIFIEFNKTVGNFAEQIKELLTPVNYQDQKLFQKKYLDLSQESLAQLLKLAEDLSLIKEYFNSLPKKEN